MYTWEHLQKHLKSCPDIEKGRIYYKYVCFLSELKTPLSFSENAKILRSNCESFCFVAQKFACFQLPVLSFVIPGQEISLHSQHLAR